jgi:TolB-like protein
MPLIALLLAAAPAAQAAPLPSQVTLSPGADRLLPAPGAILRVTSGSPGVARVSQEGERGVRVTGVTHGAAAISIAFRDGTTSTINVTVAGARQPPQADPDLLSVDMGPGEAAESKTPASPAPPPPASVKGLLAVLELRNKLGAADKAAIDAAFLTDMVRSGALHAFPGLKVMTRENMQVMVEAGGKKLEECEGECEVDTGRRLGADYIASGEVLRFGSKFVVNLKLHETHDGQLLGGSQAMGKTVDELGDAVPPAVARLLDPLRR